MKDVLSFSLGKNGTLGGIRFDLPDDKFDNQPAVALLPKMLITPFEILVGICTCALSESNKDMMVAVLADACAERLEHFIVQVSNSIIPNL